MKWDDLIEVVGSEPVFSSALLMAEDSSRQNIQLQLTRWVRAGKLYQLTRGLYVLSERHRKVFPHPFLIANRIRKASYVSLQSALAYYGLIPEYTPVATSVTTGRPGTFSNQEGTFTYRHIKKPLFHGYSCLELADRQTAFIASPEKSLLDLIYLTPHSDSWEYLRELRLQNMDRLNMASLASLADQSGSEKLMRAAQRIIKLASEEEEYIEL